jgi:uncharacterized protein YigA (DUF484 family)
LKALRRRIRRLEEEISLVVPHSEEWRRLQDELAEAAAQLAALRASDVPSAARSVDVALEPGRTGETLSSA